MVFSSLIFLFLFLPLLLVVYYLAPGIRTRNWIIILFSFLFYAWGEPLWVFLLLGASFVGYIYGLLIEKYRHTRWKTPIFVLSVATSLGILGYFKYTDFFIDNLNQWFGTGLPGLHLALPIGISFFTFEMICYLTDIYKNNISAPKSPMKVLLYISFFPHLVAGPIIRYTDIEQQISNRVFKSTEFAEGVRRFLIGLGKKVLIANVAGEVADLFLKADGSEQTVLGLWFGIIMFAIQIYFDFSGYSDMAVGLGLMFGIRLRENFNYPYIAKSASDFWRRWNISLGGFFRDYVYIPLGGNRKWYVRNLFVVWFLTGFWHGASWNFIIWGLYFGLLIYLERLFLDDVFKRIPAFFAHVYMTLAMLIGWVFFYYEDFGKLGNAFVVMFGFADADWFDLQLLSYLSDNFFLLFVAIIGSTPLMKWAATKTIEKLESRRQLWLVISAENAFLLCLFTLSVIQLVGSTYNPFLYFRF